MGALSGRVVLVIGLVLFGVGPVAGAGPGQTRLDRHGDPLPAGVLARMGTVRLRHGDAAAAVAFAPGGKLLASAGWDRVVILTDPATGREVRSLAGHTGSAFCVAISRDGKTLASGSEDRTVRLWDPATGKELRQLRGHEGPVVGVALSPDGRTLASASLDTTVRLWDATTGKQQYRCGGHGGQVYCVAFAPGGKEVASGGEDGSVRVWDAGTGKQVRRLDGHEGGVFAVAYSPDGRTIASGGYDHTVRLWDAATGKPRRRTDGHDSGVWSVAFSPDGKTLASAGADYLIRLWDVESGRPLRQCKGHVSDVLGVAFAPDGKTLASAGRDKTVGLWDVSTGKPALPLPANPGAVTTVVISPDGKRVATTTPAGPPRLWEAATGKELHRLKLPPKSAPGPWGTFTPDGRAVAWGVPEDGIHIWDAATGKELRVLRDRQERWFRFAFSPDGKSVACVVAGGGGASVWDLETGKRLRKLQMPGCFPVLIAYAGGGKTLAVGGVNKAGFTLYLWDAATGAKQEQVQYRDVHGHHFTLSPDGRMLAAVGPDNRIHFWKTTGGAELPAVTAPMGMVQDIAFSPDGRTLAVATSREKLGGEPGAPAPGMVGGGAGAPTMPADGPGVVEARRPVDAVIHLFEVATRQERCRLKGHRSTVTCVAYPCWAGVLASGSEDGTALVWDTTGLSSRRPAGPLTAERLKDLWADLAAAKADRAYRSTVELLASPAQAVPFFARQMRPAAPVDAKRIAHLIAQLDSDAFAAREKAEEDLKNEGDHAELALRKALSGRPGLEVRRRIQRILAKLEADRRIPSGTRLRQMRAVEILELLGTADARRVLKTLATGAPEDQLTQDATAALKRLEKRPASAP